ncbi:MAG: YihA family ribosome biogenesis GTP-binding protein [Lachnospiraceae bacterium]|nr:YihA family ribosome biogenesis GTP-binding protein [Lachnospiraceae bacterium]
MTINKQSCRLEKVCGRPDQFPVPTFPEIAFVGKSNVGKSSLINMLLNRKSLARTSSVPGKTRTINWYAIDEQLYFVDLPGYGYAKAAKTDQEKWARVIENYLDQRETLMGVLLLVDIRHAPGTNDLMMIDWLNHFGVRTIVVATKADKITRNQMASQIKMLSNALRVDRKDIIPVSALNKSGGEELWERILQMAGGEEGEAHGSPALGE